MGKMSLYYMCIEEKIVLSQIICIIDLIMTHFRDAAVNTIKGGCVN